MTKAMKTLELYYLIIIFLIIQYEIGHVIFLRLDLKYVALMIIKIWLGETGIESSLEFPI